MERRAKIIENPKLSLHFHHFLGGTESVGSSGIIENTWISMHSRYFFCGAENVDSSRIIENTFLVERRAREAPESLKTFGFLYIFIIPLVEQGAWEAPESLKTYGFLYTGERGKLQNHENSKISIHFHYFLVERKAWGAPE